MHFPSFLLFSLLLLSFFLPSDASIGQVLHLTDFHVDSAYSPEGFTFNYCHSIRGQSKGNVLGPIGDYGCDSSKELAEFTIAEAGRILPHPDLLLWTGDTIPHLHDYTTDYVLDTLQLITESLHRHFPSAPVLPVLGNHDACPANQMPDRPHELYYRVYSQWEAVGWLDEAQKETFLRGGYYRKEIRGQVFLVLNTNLYFVYQNTTTFIDERDPAGQFAFLEAQLAEAKSNGTKVHILAHIAPGAFELIPGFFWMYDEYNRRLVELLAKFAQWIQWALFGHNHTDTFRVIKDPKSGKPLLPLLLAPSVTPFNGRPTGNPAFRIYQFHRQNWTFTDIKTFYVDLARLNREPNKTQFSLEYSMRAAFQMDKFSAHEFWNLLERIKTNQADFDRYIRFNTVLYPEGANVPEQKNRARHLCALEFVQLDQYEQCLREYEPSVNFAPEIVPKFGFIILLPTFIFLFGTF